MSYSHGIDGGLEASMPINMAITAFTALALSNALELNVRVWVTFKRYAGLYFWSLVVSSWGVITYSTSYFVKFFELSSVPLLPVAFLTVGWWTMVTGQSLVLYSRLHLLVRDTRRLRWVRYMIIIDAIILHIPTSVLTFGSNTSSSENFEGAYMIYEKIQMTAFCIQEFIISGLYIYETRRILKPSEGFNKQRVRRVMKHLIYVNILIIVLDIALLAAEYANMYEIQTTMKGAVYGFKLRLEFDVLNQLISISGNKTPASQAASLPRDHHRGANAGQFTSSSQTRNGSLSASIPDPKAAPATLGYSAFATKNINLSERRPDDKGVVKTMEVTVHRSDNDRQPPARVGFRDNGRVHAPRGQGDLFPAGTAAIGYEHDPR